MINRHNRKRRQLFSKLRPTFSFGFLVFLLGATFSYAMLQGGFVSWFLFYSFMPFFVYSFLFLCYPLQSFQVERLIEPEETEAGENVNVTVTLTRNNPFPFFFLLVEDIIQNDVKNTGFKKVLFPGFKRNIRFSYQIENIPRGEHSFEAVRIKSADVLGLVQKEHWLDCQNVILVVPKTVEILYRPVESRFEQGSTASILQFQKDTSLVSGVRQYDSGDRFSWIDWKATARANDLMSKEFEMRQSNDILIILDATQKDNFENAVMFSASIMKSILRHGGQVGMFTAGYDRSLIPIRGGEYHQQQILRHLAKVKVNMDHPLSTIIEKQTQLYQWPAVLIVVTTVLDENFINGAALNMRRRGHLIVYLIKEEGYITTNDELSLKAMASNQGIYIKTLYTHEFRKAFLEVRRA